MWRAHASVVLSVGRRGAHANELSSSATHNSMASICGQRKTAACPLPTPLQGTSRYDWTFGLGHMRPATRRAHACYAGFSPGSSEGGTSPICLGARRPARRTEGECSQCRGVIRSYIARVSRGKSHGAKKIRRGATRPRHVEIRTVGSQRREKKNLSSSRYIARTHPIRPNSLQWRASGADAPSSGLTIRDRRIPGESCARP